MYFNRKHIPMLPILDASILFNIKKTNCSTVLDTGDVSYLPSGRIAIARALMSYGVGVGDEVLIPAFHCPSMIDPVIWVGARPVFYKIKDDISANIDDIKLKFSNKTKAVLAVHSFGFPQSLKNVYEFCVENNICLIEDCSHAFFGPASGESIGKYGDYVVASPRKFFPIYDGGCLIEKSRFRNKEIKIIKGPGVIVNIKSIYNLLEIAVTHGRLLVLMPLFALLHFIRNIKKIEEKSELLIEENTSLEDDENMDERFIKESMHKSMSISSKIILKLQFNRNNIIKKRRTCYRRYLAEFERFEGASLLFPSLEKCIAPYMFPLIVDNADVVYSRLKKNHVPAWRWEHIKTDICAISNHYSRSLIQLPCHQNLNERELSWIIDSVKNAI